MRSNVPPNVIGKKKKEIETAPPRIKGERRGILQTGHAGQKLEIAQRWGIPWAIRKLKKRERIERYPLK